jgi:hypothetical protein
MSSRSGHYFMWFIVFGLIAGLVSFISGQGISSEALWLLLSGALGTVIAHRSVNNVARYYDMIIGVIFALAGLIGFVYNADKSLLPSQLQSSNLLVQSHGDALLLGLSLAIVPSTLHLILGVLSFRHGLNNSAKAK